LYSPFTINFRELEDQRIKEEKEFKRREEEERRQRNIEEERRHKMEVGSSAYRKLLRVRTSFIFRKDSCIFLLLYGWTKF